MADKKIVEEQLKQTGYWQTVPLWKVAPVIQEGESILAACSGPGIGGYNLITNKRVIAFKQHKVDYECAHADVAKIVVNDESYRLTITNTQGGLREVILGKPVDARQKFLDTIGRGLKSKVQHEAPTPQPTPASASWSDKWKAHQEVTKIKRDERNEQKQELARERGRELGRAMLGYAGGYDAQYASNAGKLSLEGTLYCFENQIEYKKRNNDFVIPASQIKHVEISGQQQMKSRITATRILALGVFSLAAPKRTTEKEAYVLFELVDGRSVLFQTTTSTPFDMQRKLANAVSHYNSQSTTSTAASQSEMASNADLGQLEKLAELKSKGIITEEEFRAKKKQLLGL